MPEIHHHEEEGIENEEQRELREKYDRRLAEVKINLARLFDQCKEEGRDPIDDMMADDQDVIRRAFGNERIDQLFETLRHVPQDDKEAFVGGVMEAANFLFHERYFNPEIREKLDEEDRVHREKMRIEDIRFGSLRGKVEPAPKEWSVELSHGQSIKFEDRVLEISWPDVDAPQGLHDVRESFRLIASYVKDHPEIKAIVGVSWMLSRPIAKKLGFTVYPEVVIETEQRGNILKAVEEARADKPKYDKEVTERDVVFAAIEREEFIEKFQ